MTLRELYGAYERNRLIVLVLLVLGTIAAVLVTVAVILALSIEARRNHRPLGLIDTGPPAPLEANTYCVDGIKPPVLVAGELTRLGWCADPDDFADYALRSDGADLPYPGPWVRMTPDVSTATGEAGYSTADFSLPAGTHKVELALINAEKEQGPWAPILITVAPLPTEPDCTGQVSLAVGEWTRAAHGGDSGRISLSLTRSKAAITRVSLSMDGLEVDAITGEDLRKMSGFYYRVPRMPGAHQVNVHASDINGCTSVSTRPLPIVVAE